MEARRVVKGASDVYHAKVIAPVLYRRPSQGTVSSTRRGGMLFSYAKAMLHLNKLAPKVISRRKGETDSLPTG